MDLSASWIVVFVLTRAIHFGACLLVFCILVFDRFIAIPVIGSEQPLILRRWDLIVSWLVYISLPISLLSGISWFGLVAMNMSGLPASQAFQPDVLRLVWKQTHFGKVWEVRCVFWLATMLASFPAVMWRRQIPLRAGLNWIALASSGLLAVSLAWSGHGETGSAPVWHLMADAIHVLVAGLWPTGLLPFALLLHQLRLTPTPYKWRSIAILTRRFSAMSLVSVGLLTASGLVNSWALVGSVSNLFSTAYGRVLLVKLALFCGAVAIGAINLLRLKPQLAESSIDGTVENAESTAGYLQRNVMVELTLAILIVVAVAILGMLPPAAM